MSTPPVLWTYDWVPQGPRGFVRDLRVRWALEEAGLPYTVSTLPFDNRGTAHLKLQPFAQIPALEDGEVALFESGAILLYLGKKSEALMPRDAKGEAETLEWVVSALNSIEMVSVPWWFIGSGGEAENPLTGWLHSRFERLEAVLQDREFLAAGRFTIADILMADVLRIPNNKGALTQFQVLAAYSDRMMNRPAFKKAHADQLDHFAAADAERARMKA